ncbi:hypothetical protein NP493_860g01012 [Ridgeia piscesae]|uniref:Uncharacterized protein n=1 Tax=Ridgeia piscesae TaxID=27915 RepID=A0AAD9KLN3_RIDPI|nr:hypothetical protein NP493_860g01012 [Ridgeia piscesae]
MARLILVVNSSVPFQLGDTAEYNNHWVATVVSLVVISTCVLLIVFCVAIVLFIRRRRSETKTSRSPAMVMLEPRHLAGKTFAVHIRQVDRCNNDYSQLSEKQNSDNVQCAWNEASKKSFTDSAGTVGYQQNYDPLRPGIIRAADSRESLRSHDMLCDAHNGHTHSAEHEHEDSHTDGTAGPSRLQFSSETHLSSGGDKVSESGCSEDSKPDSGRGSFEEATCGGPASPPRRTTLKGPHPHQHTEVRVRLDDRLRSVDVEGPRNNHVHAHAPGKRRIRIASQV